MESAAQSTQLPKHLAGLQIDSLARVSKSSADAPAALALFHQVAAKDTGNRRPRPPKDWQGFGKLTSKQAEAFT